MRLLLRANAHRRSTAGGIEIAASPDTPNRERWEWSVRLEEVDNGPTPASQGILLSTGNAEQLVLQVSTDPEKVRAEVEIHQSGWPVQIQRAATELLVLLVHRGVALIEGRHRLAELDVLVLEGDDPLEVTIDCATTVLTSVSVIRLRPTADRALAWVP